MFRLFLATLSLGFLNSCATSPSAAGNARCCLVDPGHGAVLMPESSSAKSALEAWVNQHGEKLSTSGGAKPRFVLMYVGKDLRIKDQMPLADQSSPQAPHRLSDADVSALRACFRGGKPVKIDWANKKVVP